MRLTKDRITGSGQNDINAIKRITELSIASLQVINDELNQDNDRVVPGSVMRLLDVVDSLLYLIDGIEKAYHLMRPHTKDRLGGSLYAQVTHKTSDNSPKQAHVGKAKIELLDPGTATGGVSCAHVDVGFDMRRDGAPVFVHPNTRSAIYDHPLGGLARVTGTASEIALVLRGAGYDVDTKHDSGGGS